MRAVCLKCQSVVSSERWEADGDNVRQLASIVSGVCMHIAEPVSCIGTPQHAFVTCGHAHLCDI